MLPRRLTDQWVARLIKQAILPLAEARAERAWMRLSAVHREKYDKAGWVAGSVQKTVRRYAGKSLRAGFVTSAAAAGARVDEIIDHTGHTRVDTLMRYIRNAREIRTSAAAKLGL